MTTKRAKPEAHPPDSTSLATLKRAAKSCTACHLHKIGTQTVFGEGAKRASLMIVGEQPGDKEDLAGKPFVGPAGALLDELFTRAGVGRDAVYVTNAVKHFKWVPQGKRRLHQKPNATEIHACHPWLVSEIVAVKPTVILCLGATAAASVFGKATILTKAREQDFTDHELAPHVMVSWHPSAILRAYTPEDRHQKEEELFEDLRRAWRLAKQNS